MNQDCSSTFQILQRRPSLPSLRSLDISRYLPTTSPESPPPAPDTVSSVTTPTPTRKLSIVEEEPEEEEKAKGDVIVLKPRVSSRFGMKLTTQVCVPCKKQHTACTHVRPCPRCCRKGIEHLCVDAPSRRGRRTVGNKLPNGKVVRPPLHRSTQAQEMAPFPCASRCDAIPSSSDPPRLLRQAALSKTEATTNNSLQSSLARPSPISVEIHSSSSPSSSSSSRSTDRLSNYSLKRSYTPPAPSLHARTASLSFVRYYDSSDSSDVSSPERFPISACR